jgi:hypothetical protein
MEDQTKTDHLTPTIAQNGEKLFRSGVSWLDMLDQFNASTATVKSGDISGGTQLWSHLMSSPKDMWTKLDRLIKNRKSTFSMLDKFQEGNGLHDLATFGKNAESGPGKGRNLTDKGWCLLFHELHEETTELSMSNKGDKLCIFGILLAMMAPKAIFEGAKGPVKAGNMIRLQLRLLTKLQQEPKRCKF